MLLLFLILRPRQRFTALACICAAEFIHFIQHVSAKIHLLRAHPAAYDGSRLSNFA